MEILRFIATSKVDYTIIDEKKVLNPTSKWGWTNWTAWKKIKTPNAYSQKKVKYNAKSKASNPHTTGTIEQAQTIGGTSIPASKTVTIDGINYTVDVQHKLRGRVQYSRPSALRKDSSGKTKKTSEWKMYKTTYDPVKNNSKAYWYKTRSKSVPTYETTKGYEKASDGYGYLYFSKEYWKDGVQKTCNNPYPHPTTCDISYTDITKNQNINSTTNESDRDSKGYYILKNIRASVTTISLKWEGLSRDDTADILQLLSPDVGKNKDYLLVQFWDPEKNMAVTKTMFCNSRSVVKFANGLTKEITCTLVEV